MSITKEITKIIEYQNSTLLLLLKDKENKTTFKYGITHKKIDKYSIRIDNFVKAYQINENVELLQHRIKAFTCRTVYQLSKYKVSDQYYLYFATVD